MFSAGRLPAVLCSQAKLIYVKYSISHFSCKVYLLILFYSLSTLYIRLFRQANNIYIMFLSCFSSAFMVE